ncbi:MAG TPA: hypothetical protein VGC91_01630 [Pyrinomonadaceae bacterium]|jgi:hypothetical protein
MANENQAEQKRFKVLLKDGSVHYVLAHSFTYDRGNHRFIFYKADKKEDTDIYMFSAEVVFVASVDVVSTDSVTAY